MAEQSARLIVGRGLSRRGFESIAIFRDSEHIGGQTSHAGCRPNVRRADRGEHERTPPSGRPVAGLISKSTG